MSRDVTSAPAGGSVGTPAPPAWDAVLFDLDDTLLDLRAAQQTAFDATVRRQWAGAADVDPALLAEAAHAFAGDTGGHYARYVAGELTFQEQRLARVADALRALGVPEAAATPLDGLWTTDYEEVVRGQWALFPATADVLAEVRDSGRGVGIVTNNVEAYQRGKADALGLEWVEVLIGSDTAGAPKPDPAPFLAGCARLGTDPARTLMVGDSLRHDVEGARSAGLVPVWLSPDAPAHGEGDGPFWEAERACWGMRAIGRLRTWLTA